MILNLIFLTIFSVTSVYAHTIKNITFSDQNLYSIQEPFNKSHLAVSNTHQIFFEEFGNPKGVPVLVVHGGPGLGAHKPTSQFFDPLYYRVIMFDQRGCHRSLPFAELKNNTPQDTVHDMEVIRKHLKIDKWILFGGSYGSLLSILYGETYPARVHYFVLRGIFLGREQDYKNLFYGIGKFFPEAHQEMLDLLSYEEQENLIDSLYKRILSSDTSMAHKLAYAYMHRGNLSMGLFPDFEQLKNVNQKVIFNAARMWIHYSVNNFFLEEEQLLNNIGAIKEIPAIIAHGRYDLICLPQIAYDLHIKWPKSELWFITHAGHTSQEPSMGQALRNAMDQIKTKNFTN